jgi:hypothetical protein
MWRPSPFSPDCHAISIIETEAGAALRETAYPHKQ